MIKRWHLGLANALKAWQTAGLDAHKKPLMCGLGVPVGKVLRVLRVFRGFMGLRAGKRQAWTPIRSH